MHPRVSFMQNHMKMLGRHYATNHPLINPRQPIDWDKIIQEKEIDRMEREYLEFFEKDFAKLSVYLEPNEFNICTQYFFDLAERHWDKVRKSSFVKKVKRTNRYFKKLVDGFGAY